MDNYAKWLEKEQEWIDQMAQETKSATIRACILYTAATAAIFGLIGIASEDSVSGMFQNALWGVTFGIIMAFFMLLFIPHPRKSYAKRLAAYTQDLTPDEQEELGSQMLSSDVKRLDFKGVNKIKEKIMITRSFLASNSGRGYFILVKLDQVEQILTDARGMSATAGSNGMTVHAYDEAYSIEFRYLKPASGSSKDADVSLVLPSREIRDQVMQYVQEFVSQRPDPPIVLRNI